MIVAAKTRALGAAAILSVGTLWSLPSQADQPGAGYIITSTDTTPVGYVAKDSVLIQIAGPSAEALRRAKLTLNGVDVTMLVSQTGAGVVSGLQVGSNTFKLFESKGAKEAVAQLVVERATQPAVTCASLATLAGFPIKPNGSVGGTTITLAQLNPATATLPEHCQIQGFLQSRTGIAGPSATPQAYGTRFEVRLPTLWNGRYMFQGGGGTEGSLPAATGAQTGTASFPELSNGWAVA